MSTETIARILAQHVMRGWTDRWPLITVICLCGEEISADDHRGINRHLAVEEVLARHQEDALRTAFPSVPSALLVADAKAEAWEEGKLRGKEVCAWAMGNRPESERPSEDNPYEQILGLFT